MPGASPPEVSTPILLNVLFIILLSFLKRRRNVIFVKSFTNRVSYTLAIKIYYNRTVKFLGYKSISNYLFFCKHPKENVCFRLYFGLFGRFCNQRPEFFLADDRHTEFFCFGKFAAGVTAA